MKNYDVILFDLDGTLTDPVLGITTCVQKALEHFGIHVEDRRELTPYIGPPLLEGFQKFHGLSREQAEEAIAIYRERFSTVGLFENEMYPGIDELLEKLKLQGKVLGVATSKPEPFAIRILEHFGLDGYFDEICGAELSTGGRNSKEDVLRHALAVLGVDDLSTAVLVGDRKYDVDGAEKVGIDSIGVLYGYGSKEEFTYAVAVAQSVPELEKILLQ